MKPHLLNRSVRIIRLNSHERTLLQPVHKTSQYCHHGNKAKAASVTPGHINHRRNAANYTKLDGPKAQEIKSFLHMKNVRALPGPTCFKCDSVFPKAAKLGRPRKATSDLTLYVNKTTGHFYCIESGNRGTWDELKEYINLPLNKKAESYTIRDNSMQDAADLHRVKEVWENSISLSDAMGPNLDELLINFKLDSIPVSDLENYGLRTSEKTDSIIAPWFANTNHVGSHRHSVKGAPIGLKIYSASSVESVTEACSKYEVTQIPQQNYWCMLGLSHMPAMTRRVVVTMNEFDAIAVNFASNAFKAISLPSGSTHLPEEELPYLEQFTEIIFWFNNDLVSWEAARKFSKKLNEKRCKLVRPTAGCPSPLEALSSNQDVDRIISSAVSAEIKNIVSFSDLRGFIKDELMNFDTVCGVKWQRFPTFNKKLKGHRRGELTVVTGPTGSGKTTFMSEYSLDLVMQGVSTLWGSFEIQNVRLAKMMMKQFARSKLEDDMDNFEKVANKFQALPIHFMSYNGPQSIKDVIHTMRQAAYVYDIQHIVIDNLQFMMGAMQKNADRFMVQDMLIGEFRNFATTEHIHVSIVIHPRKEDDGLPLQISSIFGTAKATQEADNILILQQANEAKGGTTFRRKYIEIAKNRYDGELGRVGLTFDKNSLCMSQSPCVFIEEKPTDETSVSAESRQANVKDNGMIMTDQRLESSGDSFVPPSWFNDWETKK